MIPMSARASVTVAVAIGASPAVVVAEPGNSTPAPLVQPDLSAARVARLRTDIGTFDSGDSDATLLTERLEIDWSWAERWLVFAALPLAFGTQDVGTDPTYHFSETMVGNPSLLARWRLPLTWGENRLDLVASAGVIVATSDEERPLTDDGDWRVRRAIETLHAIHRPYDFGFLTALPVRADVRFARGTTLVQSGVAVHTVIDHGDPEIDLILATLGGGHRVAGVVDLMADLSVLTVPIGYAYAGFDEGVNTYLGLDVGLGTRVGPVDARLRAYFADLPEPYSGKVIALDLAYPFE
jgi:hypothetical protein